MARAKAKLLSRHTVPTCPQLFVLQSHVARYGRGPCVPECFRKTIFQPSRNPKLTVTSETFGRLVIWAWVMHYNDPTPWRARAEELRVLAETTKGGISKHLLRRIAEDYEGLARTVEQRPNRFPPNPASVHPKVRQFAPRKNPFTTRLAGIPDPEIPGFLKRGRDSRSD
jgi:hypothetical protein